MSQVNQKITVISNDTQVFSLEQAQENGFMGIANIASVGNYSDLMFVRFILLHEGGNLNGDYFLQEEMESLWPTFIGKPITWEHGEPYIGFVTDSRLVKPEPGGPDPRWYIECAGVIWKRRYPDYAFLVKEGSRDNSRRMSMEVYFADALYAHGDIDNLYTADEAPHLVDLKGREYQGKKVWRILLGTHGGGAGVVQDPADVDALILEVARRKTEVTVDLNRAVAYVTVLDEEKEVDTVANTDIKDQDTMTDDVKEQEFETSGTENEEPKEPEATEGGGDEDVVGPGAGDAEDEKDATIAQLTQELANLKQQVDFLKASLKEKEIALAEIQTEYEIYKSKIENEKAEAQKDKLAESRLAELAEAGVKLTEERAQKLFERFRTMDDDTYAVIKETILTASAEPAQKGETSAAKVKEDESRPVAQFKYGTLAGLNLESKEPDNSYVEKFTKFWNTMLGHGENRKEDC